MEMGEETSRVNPGDLILIKPTQVHRITSVGEEDLEFLAICVPAWEPDNSVFIKDVS
jgi:mannose-6-phosphate isomerase-like protein (cupin superfamily)